MFMSRGIRAALLAVALTALAPAGIVWAAPAQDAPTGGARAGRGGRARPGGPAANAGMLTVAEVERQLDQWMLVQAKGRLDLSDVQFLKFGQALRQLQMARRAGQQRRLAALRDLNALLGGDQQDETAIVAKMKELDDIAADSNRKVQDAYAGIDTVLTVRQRARFRVFEENVERRKQDLLARARQAAASPSATADGVAPPATMH
jgi:Spy/CpxP family protein refolding chaperone